MNLFTLSVCKSLVCIAWTPKKKKKKYTKWCALFAVYPCIGSKVNYAFRQLETRYADAYWPEISQKKLAYMLGDYAGVYTGSTHQMESKHNLKSMRDQCPANQEVVYGIQPLYRWLEG